VPQVKEIFLVKGAAISAPADTSADFVFHNPDEPEVDNV